MYILFEGLDLAGKSTVCRRFKKRAGDDWRIVSNSLVEDNPLFQLGDRLNRAKTFSFETLGWLFFSALLADLEMFQPPHGNTIQDSTILLRSIAYHTVNKTQGLPNLLETLIDRHPAFDFAFVCKADRDTRLMRLAKRRKQNLGPEDFLVRDDPDRFFAMEQCLIEFAQRIFGATVIDTSNLENEEGLDQVIEVLGW